MTVMDSGVDLAVAVGRIEEKVNGLERQLGERMDVQDVKLDSIHEQATVTNGRVTGLELWRERFKGVAWFLAAVVPVVGVAAALLR